MSQVRKIGFTLAALATIAGAYSLGRYRSIQPSASKTHRRVLYYVDPMHPSYKSDKPGVAPDCGMALQPVYNDSVANSTLPAAQLQLAAGAVSIDPVTQRLLGIQVAPVEKGNASRVIHAVGRVLPEDARIYHLNSGIDGFIRETYDDSVGTEVKKDQKLASYYSPDFLAVASGFLAASERVPGSVGTDGARTVPFPGTVAKQGVSSLQGYTDRLRNLGMSMAQIKHMADTRQLPESVDVVAPVDGFILARNISAGQHFDHGLEFYRVADLTHVWVVAEISEQDAANLHPGALARIILTNQGRKLPAKIADSLPESEIGGGTVKLRLEVDNPKFVLRPEMLVDVELPSQLPTGVTVPLDALIDSGAHARVYVEREQGVFEPREVETGWRSTDRVEILKGVEPGERVVAAATFLIDSESRLKAPGAEVDAAPQSHSTLQSAGLSPNLPAETTVTDPSCGMPVHQDKARASGNTLSLAGTTYYFCSTKCKEKFRNSPAASLIRRSKAGDD